MGIRRRSFFSFRIFTEVDVVRSKQSDRFFGRTFELSSLSAKSFIRSCLVERVNGSGNAIGSEDDLGSSGGSDSELLRVPVVIRSSRKSDERAGTYIFDEFYERKLSGLDQASDCNSHLLSVREPRFDFDFSNLLCLRNGILLSAQLERVKEWQASLLDKREYRRH